ncbi:MAG: hypothetical protein HQM07_06530 [Zetaproteobacteria bacterium]|nr:hypothetical protein [Zetaproteobacteria bacterium]
MVNESELRTLLQQIGMQADALLLLTQKEQQEVVTLNAEVTAEIAVERQKILSELTRLQQQLLALTSVTEAFSLSDFLQREGLESLEDLRLSVFIRLQNAMLANNENRVVIQATQSAVQSLLEGTGLQQEKTTYGRLGYGRSRR